MRIICQSQTRRVVSQVDNQHHLRSGGPISDVDLCCLHITQMLKKQSTTYSPTRSEKMCMKCRLMIVLEMGWVCWTCWVVDRKRPNNEISYKENTTRNSPSLLDSIPHLFYVLPLFCSQRAASRIYYLGVLFIFLVIRIFM